MIDLDRLATALWVTRTHRESEVEERARALVEVKPHVPIAEALAAAEEIDAMAEAPARRRAARAGGRGTVLALDREHRGFRAYYVALTRATSSWSLVVPDADASPLLRLVP